MNKLIKITTLVLPILSLLFFSCEPEEVSTGIIDESASIDLESYDHAIYNGTEYTMHEVLSDQDLFDAYSNAAGFSVKGRTITFYDPESNITATSLIEKVRTEQSPDNNAVAVVVLYADTYLQGRFFFEEVFYDDPHSNSTTRHKRNINSVMNNQTTSVVMVGQPSAYSKSSIRVKFYDNSNQSRFLFSQELARSTSPMYYDDGLSSSNNNKISSLQVEFVNSGSHPDPR
ncbi:MAG: hypothetical protein AAFQ94_27010 [Bacteroidota bacterium]